VAHVIAVDIGADSGRVMRVWLENGRFQSEEVHRFPNIPVSVRGTLYWDILRLWHEVTAGIDKAAEGAASLGLNTWGVDFALLDEDDRLLGNPVHYRDSRTNGAMEWVFERVPRRTIFERTGIQFLQLNTLFQLASLVRDQSSLLDTAATFLMMPDLFNYWFTGVKACEFTDATTTQAYNPRTHGWDWETLEAVGIPAQIFPQIVPPGTRLGEYNGIPVILPACHDTGSAVAGVPLSSKDAAYVSSGTWSLIGLELPQAVINDAAYEANLTNEGGVYGTFRFLKNVAGLWLAQQCRATWRTTGTDYTYDQLTSLAEQAEPFRCFIDPDDGSFLPHGDMPARIREYCVRTRQPIPETEGQVMRTLYESLAMKYHQSLNQQSVISGHAVSKLHVIGGGTQNKLLCQMTADAINRPVIAGPVEATALGNAVVQMITLGWIGNIAEAREIISRSFPIAHYEPKNTGAWEDAYARFEKIVRN
jgi:rhamnulokinase